MSVGNGSGHPEVSDLRTVDLTHVEVIEHRSQFERFINLFLEINSWVIDGSILGKHLMFVKF
jgi:hypothetical protein